MRLTENTQVKLLANGFVAVFEPGKPATLVRADAENVWECSWQLQDGYTEDGDAYIRECGHTTVGLDNGFVCAAGHSHFDYGTFEYYDDDEIEGMRNANIPMPSNARRMSGLTL